MSSEKQYWSYRPESGGPHNLSPPTVYDPALPRDLLLNLQVMANGARCGHLLQTLARFYDGLVRYPTDLFGEDEDPVKIPRTVVTIGQDAQDLPLLAWTISSDGQLAAAVVDLLERLDQRTVGRPKYQFFQGVEQLPETNCKVIGGKPSEILPPELLDRINING